MWIETPTNSLVNVGKATDIYVDNDAVEVVFSNNNSTSIGFDSNEEAAKALQTIKKHLQPIPAITL